MENFNLILVPRGRAALLATALMITPLFAAEPVGGSRLAAREVARRSVLIDEAQELLIKGDEAYHAGNYGDAVQAFGGAREMIPNAPLTAELHAAATERYAQASVEYARILSRKGDVAGAKTAVDKVLAVSVAPQHPGALTFRAQLDDPIRTNPALTAEHAKNIDTVRRLLYTAEGAANLGNFNEAKSKYEEVLRIDPTNTAARRGMEKVAGQKGAYHGSAFDETRATMLGQVEREWELKVPPAELDLALGDPGASQVDGFISVSAKLDRIIIPSIRLEQASLDEAIDFLRLRSAESTETGGVNITVNLGDPQSERSKQIAARRFDLQLSAVPLSQALRYLTDITQTQFTTDDYSVIISPVGSSSDELVTRTYRVPPDFISGISSESAAGAAAPDPFAETPPAGGLLAKKMSAQEALASQGIKFPEGASASYNPGTSILRVVNTSAVQDTIQQMVEQSSNTEPVMVAVRLTMIKAQQNRLEELGFDWILTNFGFGGSSWVPGAARLNLSGGEPTITRGNRSGDQAISGNAIDTLIEENNLGGRQAALRAPGILDVVGIHNEEAIAVLMRGLDQKKGVDMMAQPGVITRSGQASSVRIVREFIYPTGYEPPELPNDTGSTTVTVGGLISSGSSGNQAVTPSMPTAFEKKDVGIILEVLPVADASKRYVDITLNPSFTDFDGFVNYGSPIDTSSDSVLGSETVELTKNSILMPVFSTQRVNTSLTVADGQTIVLGGLLQSTIQNVEDSTPILGEVPLFGRLFQSKAKQPITTAIIFLINVELLDPTGRPYRNR